MCLDGRCGHTTTAEDQEMIEKIAKHAAEATEDLIAKGYSEPLALVIVTAALVSAIHEVTTEMTAADSEAVAA